GRPISATHEAHSAIRVQPIAMAIGQAAGTAAALCATGHVKPRELDVRQVQEALTRQGAVLGLSGDAVSGAAG
ncbi:MAG: FAD-dependent oxidoreductase, partial [Paenibacillus sp.]|nr:FAD-dependent oxidoreductase [Paenibacillus sp.]